MHSHCLIQSRWLSQSDHDYAVPSCSNDTLPCILVHQFTLNLLGSVVAYECPRTDYPTWFLLTGVNSETYECDA